MKNLLHWLIKVKKNKKSVDLVSITQYPWFSEPLLGELRMVFTPEPGATREAGERLRAPTVGTAFT